MFIYSGMMIGRNVLKGNLKIKWAIRFLIALHRFPHIFRQPKNNNPDSIGRSPYESDVLVLSNYINVFLSGI